MTSIPILTAQHLTFVVSGQRILDDVDLDVRAGELVWVVGPNGAGKSTLLRALAGLVAADGHVHVGGAPPRSLAGRRAFVFVSDDPTLYEDLTLREHVEFTARAHRAPAARDRMLRWLERFRLERHLDEFPTGHSKGMRQKLNLGLALGLEMPLTLLDEPYNGLDADAQEALGDGLLARLRAGGAVVLSTHQGDVGRLLLERAPRSRTARLHEGRFLEEPVTA